MTILLSDPRVAAIPVHECGESLVPLQGQSPRVLVRAQLATLLAEAQAYLPNGLTIRVVEGYRASRDQQAIIDRYSNELRGLHPGASDDEIARLASRFVSPLAVAPHVAGAAVDLTLHDEGGTDLDMGTAIDATPEDSHGRCFFETSDISIQARANRTILATALTRAGFVNYPTEWWHWSFGDRYWALLTGARHAVYGACMDSTEAAA